ncbi:MAG: hypothetical protein EOQ86_01930 [Mesorhizobium sp.]|uniref:hypothetical protein n=1 Tax=Mesorhizobium sp. TaxID=1871066 RepID=UPI000FE9377D|nr:hypothetical protein [Mesorhizobium sp.]RWH84518.1 MAG: hypothetical protein EOQ85_02920 [Mesorhizobium sp.]RWH86906.1 MAG: hypothetical protein EOQ86_01930 [Mesorhizobium sp.]RWH93556.1 MAG: hypothetical protein EOQ87_03200 [Mesorhizobium sp.]RWI02987.1 MAG: hypothetical protein EOQ88_01930 [Mesorhizobium sp.]RWI05495.1 MAG: hypothetical protein EOQ89_05965 [Mesorhizobium sp.]
MKKSNAASDSYAIEFISNINKRVASVIDAPWINIKIDYDSLYHQVWIWALVADVHGAKKAYEILVNKVRILDIDETRCDLNLMLMCKFRDGRTGHIADLCGKQDVVDFYYREIGEDDIIISDASEADIFSNN